jgi:hypothetical protein
MVITDPYCITLIVTERIRHLMEAGRLADLEPDRQYGYTCRIVFGVSIDDIAAIQDEEAGARRLVWFHLNNGRIISGDPDAYACGASPGNVTLH